MRRGEEGKQEGKTIFNYEYQLRSRRRSPRPETRAKQILFFMNLPLIEKAFYFTGSRWNIHECYSWEEEDETGGRRLGAGGWEQEAGDRLLQFAHDQIHKASR